MAEPLVSIVLPTFNGERFLDDAIRSCLEQTHRELELVIIDDGSTDGSPVIIREHAVADDRVRVYRHRGNLGLPAALNTGFALVCGELLAWTSDDNLFRPDAIAELVRGLEQEPELDVLAASYSLIDEQGAVIRAVQVPEPGSPPNVLLFGNFVGPCVLYRRRVHDVVGRYAPDVTLAEDYEYWLRAATSCRISFLHRDLYLYREHRGSLTSSRGSDVSGAAERALSRHLPAFGWLGRRRRLLAYRVLCSLALRRRDPTALGAHLVRALRVLALG